MKDKETSSDESTPANEVGERLNVYLQVRGVASRRKADQLISLGRVKVDGQVCRTLGFRVPKGAHVTVDDEPVTKEVPRTTILFHKPDLCLTSRSDPEGRTTIFDLPALRTLPRNVQSVGRLDFRSEGLILLTNDGDLAHALSHPRFSVPKTYAVLLTDSIRSDEMEKLKRGIELEDGMAKAISVKQGSSVKLGSTTRGKWVEITVSEGRNRLIRRMLEALGLKVVRLVRTAIGDIKLPETLGPGHLINVTAEQARYLAALKRKAEKGESSKTKAISRDELRKRKQFRNRRLKGEEYLEEVQRRSAAAGRAERERKEKLHGRKKPAADKAAARPAKPALIKPVRKTTDKDAKPAARKPAPRKPAPRKRTKS